MGKAIAGFWWSPTIKGTPALVVTASFFAFGGVLGCWMACQASDAGSAALGGFIDSFFSLARSGALEQPHAAELLWRTLRWPLAAFCLGFSGLGLLGIPVLAGLRGFFLSFSVTAFARAYGRSGLAAAFLLQGIPGLLSVPVFLLLSTQSFAAAWNLAGQGSGQGRRELPYHRDYFLRCGVCGGALIVSLLLESRLIPLLVSGMAEAILG